MGKNTCKKMGREIDWFRSYMISRYEKCWDMYGIFWNCISGSVGICTDVIDREKVNLNGTSGRKKMKLYEILSF